jgi:thiol-disulfide isomerase/thioredoxin
MTSRPSVVTAQRFATGLTFKDFVAQATVNKERFAEFYASGQLSADDVEFFREASKAQGGIGRIMVIGEDWCPDVFRGLPVVQRIAEAANLELRVFPRDKNLDIMNEFLNKGQFMSIPVVVFYTKELKEICHWIERPEVANTDRTAIEGQVKKEMPNASEQDFRSAMRQRTISRYPEYQKASVKEMRALLAQKLGLV